MYDLIIRRNHVHQINRFLYQYFKFYYFYICKTGIVLILQKVWIKVSLRKKKKSRIEVKLLYSSL